MFEKIITGLALAFASFCFVYFITCFVIANGVMYSYLEIIILCIVFYVTYLIVKKTGRLKPWEYYLAVFALPALVNVIIAVINWNIHNGIAYDAVPVGTTIVYPNLDNAVTAINNVGYYIVVFTLHMIMFGIMRVIKMKGKKKNK
ncbi:MAG: hypothetical protein K0R34_665 [Herbinix sp.]|jgi:hypothetical protein|nr:hypothetical protein [Herbinix sp.]